MIRAKLNIHTPSRISTLSPTHASESAGTQTLGVRQFSVDRIARGYELLYNKVFSSRPTDANRVLHTL